MLDLTGCRVRTIDLMDTDERYLVLQLINRLYPKNPWSEAYFDWQYRQGPNGHAKLRVVEAGARIVSMYTATCKRLSLLGVERTAWMVQDVMTDPAFRGRGLLNHLATLFMADMEADNSCAYTFPNKYSENSFRRSGWTELMRVPIRIASTRQMVVDKQPRPVNSFEVETAGIWREAGIAVGVSRDPNYLNWRYGRPETGYSRFILGEENGILVLKIYDDGHRRIVHLCELFVRASFRQTLVGPTLAFVHAFARLNGAELITCWLPDGHSDLIQYERAGFMRDLANNRFIFVHGAKDVADKFVRGENWHLTQGDSDVY